MDYWITDTDDTIFCDGDAGADVPNHEMVIVTHCVQLLIDALENNRDVFSVSLAMLLSQFQVEEVVDTVSLRCAINDSADEWVRSGALTYEESDNIYEVIEKRTELPPIIIHTAIGQNEDSRVLGVQLGWIRVSGNNFDIKKLTRKNCDRMYDFALENPEHDTWNIEVLDFGGKRTYFSSIPSSDLESPKTITRHNKSSYAK